MKCKRDSDGRGLERHALQAVRQQAIKAVRPGERGAKVAAALGVNIRTVVRWLSDFAAAGASAVLAKPIAGRRPKVTPEEMRRAVATERDRAPDQVTLEFGLRTLPLIGEVIWRELFRRLNPPCVEPIMRLLGFTPQRRLYRAWQHDTVWVELWRAEEFPQLRAEAMRTGPESYFADEAGIRSEHHTGRTWAPCGQTPVVKATGRRFCLKILSAVSSRAASRFIVYEGTATAVVSREFHQRLMRGAKQPIILVVDGHPTHRAKLVKEYVAQQQGKLPLVSLPLYSPQINPDEQVWGYVRARVAKQMPLNIDDLKQLVVAVLHRPQRLPHVAAAFFRYTECQYTA